MTKNKLKLVVATLLTLIFNVLCFAQPITDMPADDTDPSAAILTAAAEKYQVEYPSILKGEEEQTLDYVKQFSTRRRDYLVRMYTRGKKLLTKAAGIFKKYELPEELRVLVALESAYNAEAVSSAGAVGYWQFMDAVAKEYGLKYVPHLTPAAKQKLMKQNRKKAEEMQRAIAKQKDDRKNFDKSTVAAARYLRDRKVNLNENWLLVVASYNWGVGNVWNAMQRCGKKDPSFWDIKKYMPAETQAYVLNFITLNVIFHNYDNFVKNKLEFALPVKKQNRDYESEDRFEENINNALAESMATGSK
ncbi:MAG TPA: lytic transglycosylase domain-containing protein [Ferruginibacter sp.]|nr:lytic transglycosylase domain-containing protein [Ferruginibacter sp.]HMP19824.1 lytic transglycosylase domain-containing protein [Ferruginibacter sp.]